MNTCVKMISGLFIMAFMSFNAHSATLVLDNGMLLGADNIALDGYVGSVRFLDGSCAGLFDGCDEADDLVFDRVTGSDLEATQLAVAASRALFEQVFEANPVYDNDATLTAGCRDGAVADLTLCRIFTPIILGDGDSVVTASISNFNGIVSRPATVLIGAGFLVNDSTVILNQDVADDIVYASWSLTPVPVPAGIWLMGSVLVLLAAGRKRFFIAKKHPL